MSDLQNNLFYYATKELSQDAFICWLCSFALENADRSDEQLVKCAKQMIYEFMHRGAGEILEQDKIHLKKVEKQVRNIDVLLTVEYMGEIYKIIVEDKIHASEHDNQLLRYREEVKDDNCKVIGIYFKTGFQSNMADVKKADYKLFNRKDVLDLLNGFNSNNAIFNNYREYWENFEEIANSYKSNPLDKWPDWQAVNGFYDEMQSVLEEKGVWAGFDYVNNRSGGFWGLWYGTDEDKIEDGDFEAIIYLQVETKWDDSNSKYEMKICTKLENQSKGKLDQEIYRLREIIVKDQEEYGFSRPNRMRMGTYMTVGEYTSVEKYNKYEDLKTVILESLDQYRKLVKKVRQDYNEGK